MDVRGAMFSCGAGGLDHPRPAEAQGAELGRLDQRIGADGYCEADRPGAVLDSKRARFEAAQIGDARRGAVEDGRELAQQAIAALLGQMLVGDVERDDRRAAPA